MELGIFAKTFARPNLREVLDAVLQQGITRIQFNLVSASLESIPFVLTDTQCDGIRREFERRGIVNAALSATFNIIHPDDEIREGGFRGFTLLARCAKRLGAETLSISTGTRDRQDMWRKHPENDSEEAWREMLAAMSRIVAIAEEHSVTVAFEPERANVVDSAQKARAVIDTLQSKRVKVLMDAANLLNVSNLQQQDHVLKEAFELLGEDIALAHAKEFSADGRLGGVALGRGAVDFPLYVSLLRSAAYRGPLIMHGFPEEAVAESIACLNSALQRVPAASV